MKSLVCFTFLLMSPFFAYDANAQLGVSYNQSELPFVGINYTFSKAFMPEVRVGTNNFFENVSPEVVFLYLFIHQESVNVYAGFGGRYNVYQGFVVPVGLMMYPFSAKNFGFQMELAPIFGLNGVENLLRSSWGIRYRF